MLEPAIVKVLSRERQIPLGCGVAIAPRGHVVTCAHVVADALDVPRTTREMPAGAVDLAFPFSGHTTSGRVVAWSCMDDADIAVLACDVPERIRPIPLYQVPLARAQRFRAFGFPRGYASGRWGYGELLDAVPGGMIQAASTDLAPGFSGGPVEDLQMGRLVGVLTSYDAQLGTGFIIPAGQIARVWPQAHLARLESRFSPLTDGLMGLPGDPLTGLEQFLQEYLGTAEGPRPFGGRQEEFVQLDEWLAAADEPTAAIIAPAGRGKSALVTRWIARLAAEKRADVAFVPISIRFNTAQKLRSTMLLGARLSYLAEGGACKLASSDPDQWIGEIGQRLRESRPAGETPLLVVLDGLDEATDWRAGADLSIPSLLGEGVKVLVSARILAQDRGPEEWLERLGWPESTRSIDLPPLSSAGVADVLRSMGDPLQGLAADVDLVGELTRLSEGDPLLVSLFVEALRGTEKHGAFLKPEELTALDRGLDGYFDAWWRDQRHQWGARSPLKEAGVLAVLNALACALGPLGEADLLDLAGEAVSSWSLAETLEALARFVIGDGREQGYAFSHPRLSQYFYSRLSRPERDAWNGRFARYGRGVVERLRSGALPPEEAPPYVLQNYTAHLERTASAPADYYALLEEPWVRAWERHDGSFTGYVRDVLRAWDVAERERDVYWQIFCAFCHSSIVGLHAAPPPALIARALQEKLFNEAQVLGLLQQLDDEPAQAGVIQAIAPVLSTRGCQTAAALARGFTQAEARAAALSALAAWLPDADVAQLVQAAAELDPGTALLHAAAAAIGGANLQLLEQVLQASDDVADEGQRAELLSKLIPHLPDGSRRRVLSRSEGFAFPAARARVLAALSSYVPEDLLAVALQTAAGIWYPYRRALALVALLEHVPEAWKEQVTERARQACDAVIEDDRRAEALIRLAAHVAEPGHSAMLEQGLAIIGENVGGTRRTELLALFPERLPDSLAAAYTSALQRWTDPLQRVRLLLRVRGAGPQILQAARQMQGADLATAAALIAPQAPELIPDLLAIADALPDYSDRAEAAAILAAFMEPKRQTELVTGAARSLGSESHRVLLSRVIPKVASRLCEAACAGVREAVLRGSPGRWGPPADADRLQDFEALVLLARGPDDWDTLLSEASQLNSREARARALDWLTPLLDRERLGRAIALAWRIGPGDPDWYRPLVELSAERMPPCTAPQAEEILAAADQVNVAGRKADPRLWACALSLIASENPRPLLERVAGYSPAERAVVLTACLPRLPAAIVRDFFACWKTDEEVGEAMGWSSYPEWDALAAACPESCVSQLFTFLARGGAPPRILVRPALRMPAAGRRAAFDLALARIAEMDSAEARAGTIGENSEVLEALSIEEFEAVLAAVGTPSKHLPYLPSFLQHASDEVRRHFAPKVLRMATGWEADTALRYFESLAPMLPKAEVRELVAEALDTTEPAAALWEKIQPWPKEVQARALRFAAPYLTREEADSVAGSILALDTLDGLLPEFLALLEPAKRSEFFRSVVDQRHWWGDEVLAVARTLTEPDILMLLEHAPGWYSDSSLPGVLALLEPQVRSELFHSIVGQKSWYDEGQIAALAQLLPPSDLLLMLKHSRGSGLRHSVSATLPYLDPGSIPAALRLVASQAEDTDREELLFLLMTRMEPAGFVEAFLTSSGFSSSRLWSGDRLEQARIVEGRFATPEEFGRTLRLLGALKRPQFTAVLSTVLQAVVAYGGAEAVRGVLEASVRANQWWP